MSKINYVGRHIHIYIMQHVDTCGLTDMTKLIAAYGNFAKAPTKP
jgi:hypothetical protein